MPLGKLNKVTICWSGKVHLRVGSRTQIKVNKGFTPQQFKTFGQALEFARSSRNVRPETISEYVCRGRWGKNLANYCLAMEKGHILPSPKEAEKLEKLLGVPLRKKKKTQLLRPF
eukprot:GHVQ01006655.1.p2 GENE.GHVQ01006655.1~~GHVQ01006655.1.p2  ORF type:complete len:115 (+),score=5.16 GHVQ01006655.1:98-442(+)